MSFILLNNRHPASRHPLEDCKARCCQVRAFLPAKITTMRERGNEGIWNKAKAISQEFCMETLHENLMNIRITLDVDHEIAARGRSAGWILNRKSRRDNGTPKLDDEQDETSLKGEEGGGEEQVSSLAGNICEYQRSVPRRSHAERETGWKFSTGPMTGALRRKAMQTTRAGRSHWSLGLKKGWIFERTSRRKGWSARERSSAVCVLRARDRERKREREE